tara:strand:- start:13 stop:5871 length:5859 start_codon:yes stop_codon:yes gene_type:complete
MAEPFILREEKSPIDFIKEQLGASSSPKSRNLDQISPFIAKVEDGPDILHDDAIVPEPPFYTAKDVQVKGKHQWKTFTDEKDWKGSSFEVGLNRTKRIYNEMNKEIPQWLNSAYNHQNPEQLTDEQQKIVLMSDLFEKGKVATSKSSPKQLMGKVLEGDKNALRELWQKYHWAGNKKEQEFKDPKAEDRIAKFTEEVDLLDVAAINVADTEAETEDTGTIRYKDEYKGIPPFEEDDSLYTFSTSFSTATERDAPSILGGEGIQADTSLVEGYISYAFDKAADNKEADTENAINVYKNIDIDKIDDLSSEGFKEDDVSDYIPDRDKKAIQDEYGPSARKLPESTVKRWSEIYGRSADVQQKFEVSLKNAATAFKKQLAENLAKQGIDIHDLENNKKVFISTAERLRNNAEDMKERREAIAKEWYRGERERRYYGSGELETPRNVPFSDVLYAQGSNTYELYSTAAEMFAEAWMQSAYGSKAVLRSAADTLGFIKDAAEFATKYAIAGVNYLGVRYLTSQDFAADKTILYDLYTSMLNNRHAMLNGLHYWLANTDRASKQMNQYYSDAGVSKAIGVGKEAMDSVYKWLNIPKDQRNLFNQTLNYSADWFVPLGFLGATVRGGNIMYRNLQRSALLYSMSKNISQDINFATVMKPLLDFNVAGDIKNLDVARALNVDKNMLAEYKRLNYSPEKIQKIVRDNLTNYRMAMGAAAGYAVGATVDKSWTKWEGYQEYNGILPTLTGMAGALMHNQVSFRGMGGSILGPLVISLTNWKTVLGALKKKNIDPEEAFKMNFKGLVLKMRGWSGSDIRDMKKQAMLRGNDAILEIEGIKKSLNKAKWAEEKKKLSEKLSSTKDKHIRNRVLRKDDNGELIVNKYSVIERNMNISREHTEFINKFKKTLNDLAKTHPEQADEMATALNKGFSLFDKLEGDFPKELGSFQIILSQALQSSVLQNMMSALASKVTASAKVGKWVTDPSHLYELKKMDTVVKENILSLENVITTLRKKQIAEVESRAAVGMPEEKSEFMVAETIITNLVDAVKRQQKGSRDSILTARTILASKDRPNIGVSNEELMKASNTLAIDDRAIVLNRKEVIAKRDDLKQLFNDKYLHHKERVDELFNSLKADDDRILSSTDFVRIVQGSRSIFGPGNPLVSRYRITDREGLREAINSYEGEDDLAKIFNYYNTEHMGTELAKLAEDEFAVVTDLLSKGFQSTNPTDRKHWAEKAFKKLDNVLLAHEGVGKVIKVSDYKEARKLLADSVAKAYRNNRMDQWQRGRELIDELDDFAKNQNIDVDGLAKAREEWKTYVLPFFEKNNPFAKIKKSMNILDDPDVVTGVEEAFNMIVSAKNPDHTRQMFDRYFGMTPTKLAASKDPLDLALFKRLFPTGSIPKGMENTVVYDEKIIQYLAEAVGDTFWKGLDLRRPDPDKLFEIRKFLMNFEDVFDNVIKMGDEGYRVTGESAFKESIETIKRYADSITFRSIKDNEVFESALDTSRDVLESVQKRAITRYGDLDESKSGQTIFSIVANKLNTEGKISTDDIYKTFIENNNNSVSQMNLTMTHKEYNEFIETVVYDHSLSLREKLQVSHPELGFDEIKLMITDRTNIVRENLQQSLHVNEWSDELVYINPTEFLMKQMKTELKNDPEKYRKFESSMKVVLLKKLEDVAFRHTDLSMINKNENKLDQIIKRRGKILSSLFNDPSKDYMEKFIKSVKQGNPDSLALLKKAGVNVDEISEAVTFNLQPDLDIVAFREFMDDHKLAMKEIFGKEHLQILDDIFQLGILTKGKLGTGASLAAVASEYTVPMILGRVHAIARGVLSPRYLIMEMAVSHHRQTKFLLMREILQDEKFARALHEVMTIQRPSDYSKAYFARKLATLSAVAHIKTLRDFDKTEEESVSWTPVLDVNEIVSQISGINRNHRDSEYGSAGSGTYIPPKVYTEKQLENISDTIRKSN